ncbi:MAG: hypothetical protein H0Z35_06530 [Thermoanaerobacteraceae bacterium]|nr:hypothetical protein [Thermoanaerobacteraceae bacterium]
MDLLLIIFIIAFIVFKSLAESWQQQQKRERRRRLHPLDQQRETVFKKQAEPIGPESKKQQPILIPEETEAKLAAEKPFQKEPFALEKIGLSEGAYIGEGKIIEQPKTKERKTVIQLDKTDKRPGKEISVEDIFQEGNVLTAFILSEILQPPRAFRK